MVTVFLAEGFEEIEAITPIDVLRRGGIPVTLCSIGEEKNVTGAHGITFLCDTCLSQWKGEEKVILLPGGMPGTLNLKGCAPLRMRIAEHHRRGGLLAAICAAPTVLGSIGILKDKRATCYPGMEKELNAAEWSSDPVVVDGNVVTSRGAGTAFDFALTLLSLLKSETVAQELAAAMCFERKEK